MVPAYFMNTKKLPEQESVRINRYLAEAGICARRAADALIAEGRVTINGAIAVLGTKVQPGDEVSVDGKPVGRKQKDAYLILNKPKDCITTASDERGRRTVLDLIGYHDRVFPIGRLDRNSTGVLLLTNDGELAHRLMHPRFNVEKMYLVHLDKDIPRAVVIRLERGIMLDGERTAPVEINVNPHDAKELAITMHEGKNRQVRRMFEAMEFEVTKLDRIMYAGLTVKGMKRGEWRKLTNREVLHLKKLVKLDTNE